MSSIQYRKVSSGDRWRVVWRENGRLEVVTFLDETQAIQWRDLLDRVGPATARRVLDEDPAAHDHEVSLADYIATHISLLPSVTAGTRRRYEGYLRRRIASDPIGGIPLTLVSREVVEQWVQRMLKAGLSAKTVSNHHSLLSNALTRAVRASKIPSNPAEGVKIATPDRDDDHEIVMLNQGEVLRFIAATPEHWRPMVAFMFGTGVRWQEAAALQVGDVDLARMQAKIRRAWKDTGGAGHQLGKPKSKRSRRTVVFGDTVAKELEPLVTGRPSGAFVFTNTRGGPVRYVNFTEQGWAPAARALAGDRLVITPRPGRRSKREWVGGDGKRITPHGARHVYATIQLARGMDFPFVQRQLGHESINTTLSIYGHLSVEDLRPLADLLEVQGIGS